MNNTTHGQDSTNTNQHTVVQSEVIKESVSLPTIAEIKKEHKPVKSELAFTEKGLEKLIAGIEYLGVHLNTDDTAFKANVVKNIEANIDTSYHTFSKEFKAFKNSNSGYEQSFLNDFFKHCNKTWIQIISA